MPNPMRRAGDKKGWTRPAMIRDLVIMGSVITVIVGGIAGAGFYEYTQDNKDEIAAFQKEERERNQAIGKSRRATNLSVCHEIVRNRSVSIALIDAAFPPDLLPPEARQTDIYTRFDILRKNLKKPVKCPGLNRRVRIPRIEFTAIPIGNLETAELIPPLDFVEPGDDDNPPPTSGPVRPRPPGVLPVPNRPPVRPRPRPNPPTPAPNPPAGNPGTPSPPSPPSPPIVIPPPPAPEPVCKLVKLELLGIRVCI